MTRVIQLTADQELLLTRTQKLIDSLNPHEETIAKLAASGLSAKQIAAQLGSSPKKIERHIENITLKARPLFGAQSTFRGRIACELYCFYFLSNR